MFYATHKFHDNISTTGNGNIFQVQAKYRSLVVEIFGSATSRTIQFKAVNSNGDLISINGFNVSTNTLATQTSGINPEIWQFDIENYDRICMVVSAISGGNLSVVGRAGMEI